ncbi:AAA family ATPase [Brevundimonas sp. MEB006b]|uniref:AAA family ATPase n=1 Tax=Brevundimonas sp. MEB006b TaxID=3040283 RepID=UPI00254A106C|nr:AAA family ATPase [Brevundimonas sp. MEB006b]
MQSTTDLQEGDGAPIESPWLERLEISGFQGNRKFGINFSQNANFLIGKNGCGKTTLINLINSGLSGDLSVLFRSRFQSLTLQMTFGQKNSRYSLCYEKVGREDVPVPSIKFSILGPRGGELYEQYFYDHERYSYRNNRARPAYDDFESSIDFTFNRLNKVRPNITWLSILRADALRAASPEAQMRSPIDRKLEELNLRTTRYLSALESRASDRSARFQKDYFLSLIDYKGFDAWGKAASQFNVLNLDKEEETLGRILNHLKLGPLDFKFKLSSHFENARQVAEKAGVGYTVQDALTIADTIRIHELNEKWSSFEKDRAEIFSPRTIFIQIINELFINKTLEFSERNQPVFNIPGNRKLSLTDLSSGEKQVYIILSEALVQEEKQAVYLADEPELSLHVEWQQFLVENIFKLNPKCQVIFATHSPDILGPYGDNAIDVEVL